MFLLVQYFCVYKNTTNFPNFQIIFIVIYNYILYICEKDIFYYKVFYNKTIMGNKKEYNQYLWAPEQPRVYEASPLAISGTPMSEEDAAMSLKAENLQQSLQQNPIFKSAKQWEEQQKQREKEIAASKKWLELHPEDDNDDPYTILERGKHQAIVDGKDPSYYEKMIDDGKQFTKGALSVLSLPYLGAAAAGAYGYGASLGARGLFAGQGIYGLANENGVRKTANLIKSGDYGRAALSGAGDVLNAAMILPGAKFLGNVAKYGLKSTAAGEVLGQNVRYAPQIGGRLVVSKDYFKDPTKFYRIGTTPEKLSMEYAGENIVSGSAKDLGKVTPADAFRRTVTENSRIQPGKGANEGYWVLAPEQSNTKITNLLQKVNSSHGGETQASAGTLWEGGLNSDSRFPSVIFEGTMPKTIGASWNSTLGKSLGRSTFVRQPSENLPIGTRLGFKTGEMPIHSTNYFTETSPGSGKFFYNGEIIPENRIFSPQQFSKSNERTYLGLLERPSKLSEAERLGIPKGDRGNLSQEQLDALEDLRYLMDTEKVPNPKIKEFITTGVPYDETLGFRIKTPEGYFRYKPVGNRTQFSYEADNFPTDWGEANMKMYSNAREGKIILTSPYADMFSPRNPIPEGVDPTKYSKTIPKNVMRAFWKNLDENIPKGTYVSGDQGSAPLGQHLYEIWKNRNTIVPSQLDNSGNIILKRRGSSLNDFFNTLYNGTKWNARKDGLSTDSYMAILKQGNRPGHKLRFSRDGFTNFNNQGVENKYIYDLHQRMLNGEISQQDFVNKFNDWVKPYNGMPAKIIDGEVVIPHPFILYKQGGILKRVESGKSGIYIKPENRGKLTRLKKRTGKSEAELWKEGDPAVRKMITFARNSRKWKHK